MSKRNLSFGWIEAALRYGGVFGSAEKIIFREIFGLSEPSVSRRQAEFETLFEKACGKVLVRDGEGRVQGGKLVLQDDAELPEAPVFTPMPSLERWLQDCLGPDRYVEEEIRGREPDLRIMRPVIRAIRTETPLRITYGFRDGKGDRIISPHAIFRIKGRLHLRAHDLLTETYEDFVLARIIRAELDPSVGPYKGATRDGSWRRFNTLVMEDMGFPGGNDPESWPASDDIFDNGRWTVEVREALVPYLVDERGDDIKVHDVNSVPGPRPPGGKNRLS